MTKDIQTIAIQHCIYPLHICKSASLISHCMGADNRWSRMSLTTPIGPLRLIRGNLAPLYPLTANRNIITGFRYSVYKLHCTNLPFGMLRQPVRVSFSHLATKIFFTHPCGMPLKPPWRKATGCGLILPAARSSLLSFQNMTP